MSLTRRSILKGLLTVSTVLAGAGRSAAGLPLIPPPTSQGPTEIAKTDYALNRFAVAGFQYYDGPEVIGSLRPGDRFDLVAEPDNPHDHYAVEIRRGKIKLGYVPRSDNRHLSRLLRQGAGLDCRALEVRPEAMTWQMLRVEVSLRA